VNAGTSCGDDRDLLARRRQKPSQTVMLSLHPICTNLRSRRSCLADRRRRLRRGAGCGYRLSRLRRAREPSGRFPPQGFPAPLACSFGGLKLLVDVWPYNGARRDAAPRRLVASREPCRRSGCSGPGRPPSPSRSGRSCAWRRSGPLRPPAATPAHRHPRGVAE
jgi:hypothetical protein